MWLWQIPSTLLVALLADTYEQLGYQSESAVAETSTYAARWNCAKDCLKHATMPRAGMAAGIPIENIFQVMAVRLLPEQAAHKICTYCCVSVILNMTMYCK